MASTATYSVSNPTSGTVYYAPSAYWATCTNGTGITVFVSSWDSSGNLLSVSSLTAKVVDQTTQGIANSFTFNGGNSVQCSSTANGDVYKPAGAVGQSGVSKLTMYMTYTGTAYDQPPNVPGNLSPSNGSTVNSLTPTMSATFSDPTSGDTLAAYEIVVALNSTGAIVWDSGTLTASTSEKNAAKATHVYSGPTLSYGTAYKWKIRMRNNQGNWGSYSGYTIFTPQQAPNAPTSVTPSGTQTSLTPGWSFLYVSPGSVTLTSVRYTITAQQGGALVFDSGPLSGSAPSGSTITGTISGFAGLVYGGQYFFNITATDANSASSPTTTVSFSVASQPQVAPSSPINNATVNSHTPALAWTFTDPNYAQAQYQVQVLNKSNQATLYDSGVVNSAASSVTVANLAAPTVAPTLSASGSGSAYTAGTYFVSYTYINGNGETTASPQQSIVLTVGQNIVTTALTLPTGATGINWYVSHTTGSSTVGFVKSATTGASQTLTALGNTTVPPASNTTGSIAYGTTIQWRVQAWDSAGIGSGWSQWVYAVVQSAPTVAITAPTNGSTVTTNTPTITWTYTPSSGGFAQASAQIVLQDSNSNQIGSWTQSGTGTSFTLPAGLLQNAQSYQLQVIATDTNANSGASSLISFTVSYSPPADMQGQPLAGAHNYLLSPYLKVDGGTGVAVNWSASTDGTITGSYAIDPNVTLPVQLASGDGAATGAQKVTLASATTSGKVMQIQQTVTLATVGWVAGTTVLSLVAQTMVSVLAGSPTARLNLEFWNGGSLLSTVHGATQGDTAGQLVTLLGPQNTLIPATATKVIIDLQCLTGGASDHAVCWFACAQLEAATASDANFIAGDLGTGYSYDANNYSVRANLAGNLPTLLANPGADGDSSSAQGGTLTLTWDTTLADARFTGYLIERRRLDAQSDDTAWATLTTISNTTINSYIDLTAGSTTGYQYAIRQLIQYADGSTGISAHRAIVAGSVNFSPAWYLVNTGSAGEQVYNMRLSSVAVSREFDWVEQAVYTQFLGRVGMARDAGPDSGYAVSELLCYFDASFGDDLQAVRRQLVQMQRLNVQWYLKDPDGLAVPVYMQGLKFSHDDNWNDTLMTVHLAFQHAQDTPDY